jgi:hypothetical protein
MKAAFDDLDRKVHYYRRLKDLITLDAPSNPE